MKKLGTAICLLSTMSVFAAAHAEESIKLALYKSTSKCSSYQDPSFIRGIYVFEIEVDGQEVYRKSGYNQLMGTQLSIFCNQVIQQAYEEGKVAMMDTSKKPSDKDFLTITPRGATYSNIIDQIGELNERLKKLEAR